MSIQCIYDGCHLGITIRVLEIKTDNCDTYYGGYVDLPKGHPFFWLDYNTINTICEKNSHKLTYSNFTDDGEWRIGFNTSHKDCKWTDVVCELMEIVELIRNKHTK